MFSGVLESAYGLPPPDAPPIVPSRSATRKSRERKIEVKSGDGSSQQRKLSRAQSLRSFVAQFRGSKEGKKSSSGSRTTSSTYDDDSSQADTGSETCTPIQEECEDLDETSAKQHDSRDLVHAQLNELTIHDDGNATQHQRGVSFHVTWMTADVPRLAKEVYEKTIPDVHLSLFAYWIRERPENYEVAKKHIRELALDQGYNISRIGNMHLRKLLQDTLQMRPEWVPDEEDEPLRPEEFDPDTLATTESSQSDQTPRKKPSHGTAAQQPSTITTPKHGDMINNKLVSSSAVARVDSLPAQLRAERERVMKEAALAISSMFPASLNRHYPPDTPDRPKPLSLRSPSSSSNCATPTPTTSSPPVPPVPSFMYRMHNANPASCSPFYLDPLVFATSQIDRNSDADDVFTIAGRRGARQHNIFNPNIGMSRRYASNEPYSHHYRGPHALHELDTASETTNGEGNLKAADGDSTTGYNTGRGHAMMGKDSFDALSSYIGTSEGTSILDRNSFGSDATQQYRYSPTTPSAHVPNQNYVTEVDDTNNSDYADVPLLYRMSPDADLGDMSSSATSYRATMARTLDAFPVPPTQNPVGELALSVAHATSLTYLVVPSRHMAESYRAIAREHIIALLQRTRGRGSQLEIVDWEALSIFEQAWREVNKPLIRAIYGRVDIVLDDDDVEHVQALSKELGDDNVEKDWVWNVFLEGEKEQYYEHDDVF